MFKKVALVTMTVLLVRAANGQSPNSVYQVLMDSATLNIPVTPTNQSTAFTLMNALPNVFAITGTAANCANPPKNSPPTAVPGPGCFTTTPNTLTYNQKPNTAIPIADAALSGSIATALSTIPIASPGSAVLKKIDPASGQEVPASGTLGPIFAERAETIGKGRFFIGLSNQDFHFTSFNGKSLNNLTLLDKNVVSAPLFGATSNPVTYSIGMDVRLSQDMAFLTYGVTDRFDLSVGLPEVHAAVQARTYNGLIYGGNGLGVGGCWCSDTFTPGAAPSGDINGQGMTLFNIGNGALGKTGFGDILVRGKYAAFVSPKTVVAVGADVRLPTGDAKNYLGIGTTAVRPFLAVSRYSKELSHGIVISPHFNAGWQFTGKSILGGLLTSTAETALTTSATINYYGSPYYTPTKDYLPDVFSWVGGAEIGVGGRSDIVVDVLGNEIGWIHGIQNMTWDGVGANIIGVSPTSAKTSPCGNGMSLVFEQTAAVCGFVNAGRVWFGQYSGAFGYKLRVTHNLVATFNMLTRFDNNGLTARLVPFYGLNYTFR